jgi:hypothetical protein
MSERQPSFASREQPVKLVQFQYLAKLLAAAKALYLEQETLGKLPRTGPQAAHRRAFILAMFNIFMAESTETVELGPFRGVYPRIKLPLKGLVVDGCSTFVAEESKNFEFKRHNFDITFRNYQKNR